MPASARAALIAARAASNSPMSRVVHSGQKLAHARRGQPPAIGVATDRERAPSGAIRMVVASAVVCLASWPLSV